MNSKFLTSEFPCAWFAERQTDGHTELRVRCREVAGLWAETREPRREKKNGT